MIVKYNYQKIEKKWQAYWQKRKTFLAKDKSAKPKRFVLVEFPYPSGEGLHMGHLRPYVAGDVTSRYWRLKGREVMYPIGWDAFGLPAENYAIKKGVQPKISTAQNIKNAKRQVNSWGMSFDWSREVNTTDPKYFKWTQWIFLQFFKKGLAYQATGEINWCPKDKTGLANEEVIDGKCERCGTAVEKKQMRQWYLKITAYAEKLLEGLKTLNWPEHIKLQQENWIGKSTGAEIEFPISGQWPAVSGQKSNFLILHGRNGSPDSHTFPWLKNSLEAKGYAVQASALPNTSEPSDEEQVEYVLKNCEINENTIIVGHSFGGVVALRLLERGVKVKRVFLLCTPYSGKFLDKQERPSVTQACEKGFNFKKIKAGAQSFSLLYDTTDYVVPMSDGGAFAEKLGAPLIIIEGKEPHLSGKQEPEVLDAILPKIKVFTTRPDTLFGATYMVVAPEHPIIKNYELGIRNYAEVKQYIDEAKDKSELQRTQLEKAKTGVELKGIKAINPATKEEIPIWVADFVLGHYGTGAIMAVPAHDERDFAFAKKFGLPVRQVITPTTPLTLRGESKQQVPPLDARGGQEELLQAPFVGYGTLINSGKFTGMKSEEAISLMAKEFGNPTVQYKLRDWVFSRQRYWGEPIPLIHCGGCGTVPVPEKDLPVTLPSVKKYEPTGTGESPLAAIAKWVNVKCPKCGEAAKRETNTMPQWAGSSWYWLRYADPKNAKAFASEEKLRRWTPVDTYFGGMEHTTLHLLYSRFWNLFLYDQKLVPAQEPYAVRVPHGIVLGPDGEKMSKSRGNVVNPDSVVKRYGADTLRMYELFLGPHEAQVAWSDQGIIGIKRFLDRVWSWFHQQVESSKLKVESTAVKRALHRLIKKVGEDIENYRFNTAISALMEFHNQVKDEPIGLESLKTFLIVLYPFAPHIAEELHQMLGFKKSLQLEKWPKFNAQLLVDDTVNIVVQINGKVREKIQFALNSGEAEVKQKALALDKIKTALAGSAVKRTIFVQNRLINFVL